MNSQNLFAANALTLPIAATSTASSSTALPAVGSTIRVINEGPNTAFISIGVAAQTATLPNATPTTTSTPVLAGSDQMFNIPNPGGSGSAGTPLNISAICRAGATATLQVQVGEGV